MKKHCYYFIQYFLSHSVLFLFPLFSNLYIKVKADTFIPPQIFVHDFQPLDNAKRLPSSPYISGDSFRSIAQFVIDETRNPIDPDLIKDGDILFVKPELFEYFFTVIHPRISHKYILISHNSDLSSPGTYRSFLNDNKIIAWFAVNTDISNHPKLIPIPIGIANAYCPKIGDCRLLDQLRSHLPSEKKHLLYVNFLTNTNPERKILEDSFAKKIFCYNAQRKSWPDYLIDMGQSKFVLCPHGNGLDCHRTWEALLMGSIPIVKTSTLDPLYKNLPILIIQNWSEITEELLNKKYAEITSNSYNLERLFAPYWIDQIKKLQSTFRTILAHQKFLGVDFDQSMARAYTYQKEYAKIDPTWQQVKYLYNKNSINELEIAPNPRIPKIIHQIWIGSPLPEKYKTLIATWKQFHPDWQHKLWTDKDIEEFGLINKDKYDAATNMGEKSDIAKWEIIYRYGGLYVDTDFECLKAFDLFHHSFDFYTGIGDEKEFLLYAALFAAHPHHPILKKCVENLHYIKTNSTDANEIIHKTGPYFFTRCAKECLNSLKDRSVFFPVTNFYPWPGRDRFDKSRAAIEKWFKPESFAVHHWHQSWMKH